MPESTRIPPEFASSWSEFLNNWCLGVQPAATADKCGRALKSLLKHWPERTQELLDGPIRGVNVVASAIDTGLVLEDAAELPGVHPVMLRLRNGEQSALSELIVGATLSRLGLSATFGVATGTKILDLAIAIETITVFVEVIAPDRAEIIKSFTDRLNEIALAICQSAQAQLILAMSLGL